MSEDVFIDMLEDDPDPPVEQNYDEYIRQLTCYGCGCRLFDKRDVCYYRGTLSPMAPLFCSPECEETYRNRHKAGTLTFQELSGIYHRMRDWLRPESYPAGSSEEAEKS